MADNEWVYSPLFTSKFQPFTLNKNESKSGVVQEFLLLSKVNDGCTSKATTNQSNATTEHNAAASKRAENSSSSSSSSAARTCSRCFEKKSEDEFSSRQWHKGIAGRCQTCTKIIQRPASRSIFKAALEVKFRALLSSHLCDASNHKYGIYCSRAIVTYVGLNSNGVTFNMGNFDIQLLADGTLAYLYRKKSLRLVSKSDCCTIKIRIFGTKEPGACVPPKYIYVLFKQGQNLLQCSPEDHLKSVIESNEYYPEEHEYYC